MVQKLGAEHPTTLVVLNNLALAYQADGKPAQALPLFGQAAAGVEKLLFKHEHAERIVSNLVACQQQLQQYADAETWLRKWLAVQSGADAANYAQVLTVFGMNLLKQKKWTDAEGVLREFLAFCDKREKKPGVGSLAASSWQVANVKSLLGAALAGQQKYAEAEPLLLGGYTGMKQREADIPAQGRFFLIEARERLVQLYEAMSKKADADAWRKKR
jgi:eukaryotic-like serine/threonine-protein kinase